MPATFDLAQTSGRQDDGVAGSFAVAGGNVGLNSAPTTPKTNPSTTKEETTPASRPPPAGPDGKNGKPLVPKPASSKRGRQTRRSRLSLSRADQGRNGPAEWRQWRPEAGFQRGQASLRRSGGSTARPAAAASRTPSRKTSPRTKTTVAVSTSFGQSQILYAASVASSCSWAGI